MKEKRLLERIGALQVGSERSHLTQAEVLLDSLMAHLSRILNTRQGSVPIDPDFGVPDFTNLAGSFATGETAQIIEHMTRMVARYEPRLKSPASPWPNMAARCCRCASCSTDWSRSMTATSPSTYRPSSPATGVSRCQCARWTCAEPLLPK